MNEQVHTARGGRRRIISRVIAAVAVVAAAASVTGMTYADDAGGGMPGHGMHRQMDPAKMAEHLDRMVARIAPDATPEQKTRLTGIFKAAFADLKPLHQQQRANHQKMAAALAQANIDRAAIEQLRQQQMQIHDQVSRRMTQAFADAAEVLTPEQRAKAAERMQQHMKQGH
jgi:Spy/CpxP family protein refolding chaperone